MKADIAIITIRDDEFGAVFDRLEEYVLDPLQGSSGRTYAIFSVPTRTSKTCIVALARSPEQGSDVAQQVASDIIRDLDPQLLLVVGIAGGIPDDEFTLGDVIISSRIHNFNVNAFNQNDVTFDVRGGIHPRVSNIVASLPMYRNLLAGWNTFDSIGMARPLVGLSLPMPSNLYGDAQWQHAVLKSLTAHSDASASQNRPPLFKTGSIASSNTLMKNTEIPTTWLATTRSILAVEMEAAGVLQAAQQMHQQYPVMAIRGISDIIGLKRDARWTSYACQSAGAFTCAFIKAGIVEPQDSGTTAMQGKATNATSPTGLQAGQQPAPLDVFISYSADDEKFKKELEAHLAMPKREGIIRPCYSQQTEAGLARETEIRNLIDRSQLILLLISPGFLASDHLYDQELQRAMQRHASGAARVVPIIIRPANLGKNPIKDLQALPRKHLSVDSCRNHDEVWLEITREILDLCTILRNGQIKS